MIDKEVWDLYKRNYNKISFEDVDALVRDLKSRDFSHEKNIVFIRMAVKMGTILHQDFEE